MTRQITFQLTIEALEDQDELDPDDVNAFTAWADDVLSQADFFMRVGSLEREDS